jgi:hypothetical protein
LDLRFDFFTALHYSRRLRKKSMSSSFTAGKRLQTARTSHRDFAVNVIESGVSTGRNSTSTGKCTIQHLPPELPAGTFVEVFFSYGENGQLTWKADCLGSNEKLR